MSNNSMELFNQNTADWFQNTFGSPTAVQEEAWEAIAKGEHTLVSAPTGTGKTLSAFLIFIDRLKKEAEAGILKQETQLIYISPLKSLAGDIRENLRRPLDGITGTGFSDIVVGVRTGDTTQNERRRMIKYPPHILITTPESLYLLLTSKSGQSILCTARAVIIDELHAVIDTKRGAHLMLSIARLDNLCQEPLQRIGLSATIEPLHIAASYLSPDSVTVAAPRIKKEIKLEIVNPLPDRRTGTRKDSVWEELSEMVYERCLSSRSVIAFVEGRRYAEKLAYYVNQIGGERFARTHHGSLSKDQRQEVEQDLREGSLRLLCATSSMELGIDVGEIDQVLQVGCPRTISGTMQRLGRAGHNPGRISIMYLFPRTVPESIACGLTAEVARMGGVEYAHPPTLCLDVLAQHLVSMAVGDGYDLDEVMDILARAYSFQNVTKEDVKGVLCMLAGDYEHKRDIPVRPRLLYDRLHERVEGDAYSRMLAISTGGTIPDKGLYAVKTEEGVKLGELDEEFIYESRKGDKFLLGTFAWKIVELDKDTVIVTQVAAAGARIPFWKGEIKGRAIRTGYAFGKILRELFEAYGDGNLVSRLHRLGLDDPASQNAADFLKRQIEVTGVLPNDRTIIVEHFRDQSGVSQIMVHSIFGRQVNAPLSILMQQEAMRRINANIACIDDEDGFLLYPYGEERIPEGILQSLKTDSARKILEAVLPATPLFNMTFRYNAARALMMGVKKNGRQPLWLQRIRSADMLDSVVRNKNHPIIRETKRECMEDQWDIKGVERILSEIQAGILSVHELYTEMPSPMCLPLQWQVEAAMMYDYSPTPKGIHQAVEEDLSQAQMISPSQEQLEQVSGNTNIPADENQVHSQLMIEGDKVAEEIDVPIQWLETLVKRGQVKYREPGLWIAAEQEEQYRLAFETEDMDERINIVRRMLRYRGAQSVIQIAERYFWTSNEVKNILENLCECESVIEHTGLYYHAKLYDKARRETVKHLRQQMKTVPAENYCALMVSRMKNVAPAAEQLEKALKQLCGQSFSAALWEEVLLPARVKDYREALLDSLLAQGDFFWQISLEKGLCFRRYDEIDWEINLEEQAEALVGDEKIIFETLRKRGASFLKALSNIPQGSESAHQILLRLAEKGLVCADSFVPVRQWLNKEKLKKTTVRQRVNSRVMALAAGRWDIVHPISDRTLEEQLNQIFDRVTILCRETAAAQNISWTAVLEILRVWEYTGRARRGYFVEGLSGAQFIRVHDFTAVMSALEEPRDEIRWLSAADPCQIWGKILPHKENRAFLNVAGTVVALRAGIPVVVLERRGKLLRVLAKNKLSDILSDFVQEYRKKRLFPSMKRIVVKEYPENAAEALLEAGFLKEMMDYVLYR